MSSVPTVKHANFTILPGHGGSMLPGRATVAYSCVSGYELENPDNNIVECEYGNDDQNRTAFWTGQEKIQCVESKF